MSQNKEVPSLTSVLLWAYLLLTFVSTPSLAQVVQDSVRAVTVAPGVIHTSYTKAGPYTLDVLEIDLSNPDYRIESYRPTGLVRTSQQARDNDREVHRVIAAINADFFSFQTGWPVGNQVVNGQFAFGTQTPRSHLAMSSTGGACMERLRFKGWLRTSAGKQYDLSGVNDIHKNNAIILHTSFSDTATPFSGPGIKVLLQLVSAGWSVGDTLKLWVRSFSVEELRVLGYHEALLWIGGGTSVWGAREDVRIGDTLLVYLGFQPDLRHIQNVVGGAGMILLNGKCVSDSVNVEERTSIAFLKSRHPRTFVAVNRDTSKLLLCTVDGRQESSMGMSFQEMSDFLLSLGAWNAINLDGGGSTTMVINGTIVNSPSDKTGERPVANSLQIIKLETR